ncbi:MAG: 5-(carboxyamino)imidazole ribonucleotide synthase [Oligoflexia bacterium]|nr:5-(carboxyamino)imidazole ribonucleotide synthase [Oligoflexia bacterium]
MLAQAGRPLGVNCKFWSDREESCCAGLGEIVASRYEDELLARRFGSGLDVVTFEFENIPAETLRTLSEHARTAPPPLALEVSQDRLKEKELFRSLGMQTAPFVAVSDLPSAHAAANALGFPLILKTRRLGYDGKGQALVNSSSEIETAMATLGGVDLIAEGFVRFSREISMLAARNGTGKIAFYDPVLNLHAGGILRCSIAPAPQISAEQLSALRENTVRLLNALNYIGVIAIEFFEVGGGYLANEFAPRVHNSGHWTIDGAKTSQFETHLRAILGQPFAPTTTLGRNAMLNLIGALPAPDFSAGQSVYLHLYGKTPRPGRKVGHINIRAPQYSDLSMKVQELCTVPGVSDASAEIESFCARYLA